MNDEMMWVVGVMLFVAVLILAVWIGAQNIKECESKGFSTRYCVTH